jgi:HK97 family phage portal protein
MGFMRGLGEIVGAALVERFVTKSGTANPDRWFRDWAMGGGPTTAGISVSPETAMRTAAVWACVNVRSEDVGKLDCFLYRDRPDGGREVAINHPLYRLVNVRPNPRMTAFEFRQMLQAQVDLRGNGYAWKEFDGRGQVVALWPLDSSKVTVFKTPDGRELFYRCELLDRSHAMVPAEEIFHLRGLTLDGCVGLSPISYHRETIGLAIAAEKYGAAFFGNNAQPMGALEVTSVLSPEARTALRDSWKERHLGKRELAILDGGMKWVQTGVSNEDSQYIESRQMTNSDIWRIYRMPPHKVQDLSKATFTNIEHQSLDYVNDCLSTVLKRWTETLARELLTAEEQAEFHFEFDTEDLLRGDLKSRCEAFAILRNWGILNANECRARLGENPREGGDEYLQPLNMIEAGTPPPGLAPTPPAGKTNGLAFHESELKELSAVTFPAPKANAHG